MSPPPSAAAPSRVAARGSARRRTARLVGVSAVALAAALAGLQPLSALAGPEGGKVKRGEARIETHGAVTTIRQGGSKVVIDWESFDVGADEVVRFLQPGRESVALNRVLDAAPSHIRGRLEANGNVWLINRHGVIFHQSSVVNVGGLLASTADITDDDFMAGRYEFGIPGAPGARVVAEGEISFADHGLVGLIGAHAENRGVIRGRVGQVVVAGAETYAVDLAGDGLFAFEFDEATAGVSAAQAGEIVNAGGEVLISAASADAMVDNVVSVEGVVSADLADGAGGAVTVSAPGGEARLAGEIGARGGDGGRIDVRARRVAVSEGARLDVSGAARGGETVVIAEEHLDFAGVALARGAEGGGFIETS
ncbi:MAG: filamentous hemagglutinin N-terminal domain-containing protein, partial [Paracoccaceae bacterium]